MRLERASNIFGANINTSNCSRSLPLYKGQSAVNCKDWSYPIVSKTWNVCAWGIFLSRNIYFLNLWCQTGCLLYEKEYGTRIYRLKKWSGTAVQSRRGNPEYRSSWLMAWPLMWSLCAKKIEREESRYSKGTGKTKLEMGREKSLRMWMLKLRHGSQPSSARTGWSVYLTWFRK